MGDGVITALVAGTLLVSTASLVIVVTEPEVTPDATLDSGATAWITPNLREGGWAIVLTNIGSDTERVLINYYNGDAPYYAYENVRLQCHMVVDIEPGGGTRFGSWSIIEACPDARTGQGGYVTVYNDSGRPVIVPEGHVHHVYKPSGAPKPELHYSYGWSLPWYAISPAQAAAGEEGPPAPLPPPPADDPTPGSEPPPEDPQPQ